jgi:hypothetical protein
MEQRRLSLESDQPDITRGIGKISPQEILEQFRLRRGSYYMPVARLAKEASAQSAEARHLSTEGYVGGVTNPYGLKVLLDLFAEDVNPPGSSEREQALI